eukprot:6187080-Pleurochrysis_carterae.AAC.2
MQTAYGQRRCRTDTSKHHAASTGADEWCRPHLKRCPVFWRFSSAPTELRLCLRRPRSVDGDALANVGRRVLAGVGMHLQHGQRLDDLGVERVGRLEQVEQLAVVHLEEHAGDLAGELRLD